MHQKTPVFVALLFVVLFAFLSFTPAFPQQSDTTPPELVDFDFNPKVIDTSNASQDVLVSVHATDDVSGIERIEILWVSGNQRRSGYVYPPSGADMNEIFECMVTFPQYSEQGDWTVSHVHMRDRAGNNIAFVTSHLADNGFPTTLTQEGIGDITGPSLVDFDFNPKVIDTSNASQDVLVSVHATDDVSGIERIEILWVSGNQRRSGYVYPPSGADMNEIFECMVTFPQYSEQGDWTVSHVHMRDRAGNNIAFVASHLADNGFPTTLTQEGIGDITGPSLVDFDFNPKVIDTSNASQDVLVSVHATDDVSGIERIEILWVSGNQRRSGYVYPPSGADMNEIFECVVTFPQYSEQGDWTVSHVHMRDRAGNNIAFVTSHLIELGFPTTLKNGPDLDVTPPRLIEDFVASDGEDSQSVLSWTNPPDSDLHQVVVKRKTTGYPRDHADGDTRITIDSATPGRRETFTDGGLTNGQYYYYTVFSCDSAGNWNDNSQAGNSDIGVAHRPGDGNTEKYALLVCGESRGDFLASMKDLRSALSTWWYFDHTTTWETWNATKEELEQGVRSFCSQADGDDILLFYYVGHGGFGIAEITTEEGSNTILYQPSLSTWLSTSAASTLILLDTCHSGSAIQGSENITLKGPTRWVLTSCDGSEEAQGWAIPGTEWTAFMRFTRNFIRAMSWEDPSIAGSDNLISLQEAFGYADKRCNQKNPVLSLRGKGWQDPQIWPAEGELVVQPQRGKPEAQSSLFFGLLCPVDLSVIDPMGRRISLDTNEIGDSAFYVEADFNSDGHTEVLCKIHVPVTGEYSADVTPHADASPTDTFSFLWGSENSVTTLADSTEVEDIPEDPYTLDPSINTPVGDNARVVFPDDFATLTFDSITESGNTDVCTTEDFPSGPFPNIEFLGKLYEFTTTANHVGNITIELLYNDNSLTSYEETALKLFKITEDGTATDITTGLDTEQNLITGVTDSFSSFAVGVVLSEVHTPAVFRVTREGDVRADGAYYGQSFETGSADVAEWVPVSESVEPGDVLELDPTSPGHYRKARGPCSTLVGGVVSSKPGVALGADDSEEKVLLALIGIVPVKVIDKGGPIQPGDLLTTSSVPGYAMRCDNPKRCEGAIIGKALEPLEEGIGVIKMLVMQ